LFGISNRVIIYDDAQRKLMFFDTKGEFILEHRFDFSIDGLSHLNEQTILLLTDERYNVSESGGHILSYVDLNGFEVNTTMEIQASNQLKHAVSSLSSKMVRIGSEVILQIPFCDTLFQVSQGSYSPKYVFNLKGTGLKPAMMKDQISRRNVAPYTTQCSTPYETSQFLLFRVDYKSEAKIILQDKRTKTWKLLEAMEYSKPGLRLRGVDQVAFTPMFCSMDYYYSFIEAIDFKTHFSEAYPKLAEQIDIDDNPIIVRAKLK